jgi:hypothetical protein
MEDWTICFWIAGDLLISTSDLFDIAIRPSATHETADIRSEAVKLWS